MVALVAGCRPNQDAEYPQGQYGQQPYPQAPGQYGPAPSTGPTSGITAPGAPTPTPAPAPGAPPAAPPAAPPPAPTASAPAPGPAVNAAADPINVGDINWLRIEAGQVMGDLIAGLSPTAKPKVQNVPFIADPTPGEVNAYAGCDDQGQPFMAITDGILQVSGYIAQFKATDEIFGTRKVDAYIQYLARNQKPNQPIVRPPASMIDPVQHLDARKVARQRDVYDEMIAFILGHELAHHYLGHTGCANGGGSRTATWQDAVRVLRRGIPWVNAPNEAAADTAGTNNLLTAGARRKGYHWTEGGALLTLNFFAQLEPLNLGTFVFAWLQTHPHPYGRIIGVQATATAWRLTGGNPPLGSIFGTQ